MAKHHWMRVVVPCMGVIALLSPVAQSSKKTANTKPNSASSHAATRPAQGYAEGSSRRLRPFSMPLAFEPEAPESSGSGAVAQFVAHGARMDIALTRQGIELAPRAGTRTNSRVSIVSMRFLQHGNLVDMGGNLRWRGVQRLRAETNYLVGNNRAKWRTHVARYARVEAVEGKTGISVYTRGDAVEYDLRVPPGADASQIRLAVSGARRVSLDRNGNLIIQAGAAEFRMNKPGVYKETALSAAAYRLNALPRQPEHSVSYGSRVAGQRALESSYVLEPDGTIGFRVTQHDPRATIVIDPTISLAYSSFLGGAGGDIANSVVTDSSGNVYVAGTTTAPTTFPEATTAQLGPGLPANPGPGSTAREFFVAKIDPTKTGADSLAYLTFLGGSTDQAGGLIAVDSAGDVAITGTTSSADFPVTDATTRTAGTNDTVVSELDPTGSNLLYSTIFGGSGAESQQNGGGIAFDSSGDIFVTSDTNSPDLPVTSGAYAAASAYVGLGQGEDGFLAVFQPTTMPALKYCTYLGVTGITGVGGIAVDASGDTYIAGFTNDANANFPFANAVQPFFGGGAFDAFVMKIAPAGNGAEDLTYATLLGGNNSDKALAVALDSVSPPNIYITGTTSSINFPINGTVAAFQPTLPSNATTATSDAFVSVIAQNAMTGTTSLAYSTYLGGSQSDTGYGIEAAQPYAVYVAGTANSWDFPWHDNFQPFNGYGNAFLAKLDTTTPDAAGLIYSTPVGGTSPAGIEAGTQASAVAVDSSGNVWLSGQTTSLDFASAGHPGNGFQQICGSCQESTLAPDGFVAEIQENATQQLPSLYFAGPGIPLNFGNWLIGATDAPLQFAAIKNGGEATLNITNIGIIGPNSNDFALSDWTSCQSAAIAPGGLCSFEVSFVPSVAGPEEAFVQVTSNASGSPQVLEVVGTGGGLSISPTSLNFDTQTAGTTSGPQAITLTNTAGEPTLYIDSIAEGGSEPEMFIPANTSLSCRTGFSPMPPESTCSVLITFAPTITGSFTADVDIQYHFDGLSEQEQIIPLSGTGTAASPAVILSPLSLGFGSMTVGQTSAAQIVTVTNTGNAALDVTTISLAGANATDFATVSAGNTPCPKGSGSVAASASCTVGVQFAPKTAGAKSATLTFADDAAGSPQTVSLTGTAQPPAAVQVTPTALTFGPQAIGTKSTAQQVTIANTGGAALAVNGISVSGTNAGDFSETNNCPPSLAASANCVVSVVFDATAPGARAASLTIADDGAGSPQQIPLTGTATQAAVTLSSASINFGNQPVGIASSAISVTVTNSGNGPLVVGGLTFSGTNGNDFSETDNCKGSGTGAGIAAGGTCAIQIVFKPECGPVATATRVATLSLEDNAPGSPQTVTVTGIGTGPFCFIVPAGGSTLATLSPGQTGNFALQVEAANAFTGNVNLTCAGAPVNGTCTVAPTNVNIGGSQIGALQVSVATSGGTAANLRPGTSQPGGGPDKLSLLGWIVLASLAALIVLITRSEVDREGTIVANGDLRLPGPLPGAVLRWLCAPRWCSAALWPPAVEEVAHQPTRSRTRRRRPERIR
ncbi:MAG TPA: choice-of-anchor D domain-containing protein [Candidatus Acidoferrales bacterium]|nr:choice-of-anchor D domain-containing protein [Candidatus Acidoferrales bacterium]